MLALQILGAALLLIAYWQLQVETWDERSAGFLLLNIVGAGLLATLAWIEWQIGFALVNSVWLLVSASTAVTQLRGLRHNRA